MHKKFYYVGDDLQVEVKEKPFTRRDSFEKFEVLLNFCVFHNE